MDLEAFELVGPRQRHKESGGRVSPHERRPDPRTDQPSARSRWTSAAGEFAGSRRLPPCILTVTDMRLNPSQ